MTITLALSGSNLTGDVPFSVALSSDQLSDVMSSPAGERGDLATLCRSLCDKHNVKPAEVNHIVVDVGPGSYTGLRVAVTFVRFLQSFGAIEVHAVDSLAVLAMHACGGRDAVRIRPLLDARRGRYHTACFDLQDDRLSEVEASSAPETDEVLSRVKLGEVVVMPPALGDVLASDFRDRSIEVVIVSELTAASLLAPGLPLFVASEEDLEPRYLMSTYAED